MNDANVRMRDFDGFYVPGQYVKYRQTVEQAAKERRDLWVMLIGFAIGFVAALFV